MGFNDYFKNSPIVAWNFDSVEDIYDKLRRSQGFKDLKTALTERIKWSIYPVIFDMGMKFNLGGEQEKEKLITTDKPIGIFDFSLASNGLYRVPEYYSIELERDSPDQFKNLGLHAGVIPPNLVQSRIINGVRNFYYSSDEKEYAVTQRQKGATALAQGDPNAKLKFATKNKKVYLKFRRRGGKVNYCEIYTLYYYTSMDSRWQFNMRHLPVLLLAEYFEKTGIKTRLYPTRFANPRKTLTWPSNFREYENLTGASLPQYEIAENKIYGDTLIVAPLMVKDFGKEIDYFDFFAISDQDTTVYDEMAQSAFAEEFIDSYSPYGRPDQPQLFYLSGFERYKNKYAEYVKRGLWKSKEVQPEAQLFFHSQSIRNNFSDFWRNMFGLLYDIAEFRTFFDKQRTNSNKQMASEAITLAYSPLVREFFEWWMKLCALRLKTQMSIINSKTPRKAMKEAAAEVQSYGDTIQNFLVTTAKKLDEELLSEKDSEKINVIEVSKKIINVMSEFRDKIFVDEDMVSLVSQDKSKVDAKMFIEAIINETTIFVEKDFFPTPKEDVEKRTAYADYLIEELEYL